MPELLCDRCDQDYVCWSAPSDIWNRVIRAHGGDGYGDEPGRDVFLCPTCFSKLGAERGVAELWLLAPLTDGPVNLASQLVVVPNDDVEGLRFASLR